MADDEDIGYLDLLEQFQDSSEELTSVALRIVTAIEELTEKTTRRTGEIEAGHSLDQSSRIRHLKRVADATADDLDIFVARIEIEIPVFADRYKSSTNSMTRAASVLPESGDKSGTNLRTALAVLSSLATSSAQTREKVGYFRDVLRKLPKATTRFIRSRDKAVTTLDNLASELDKSLEHIANLKTSLEGLLRDREERS